MKRRRTLLQFASGDIARKYLVDEPILAHKGDPGYDPDVEREVKAALSHRQPPSVSEKAIRRNARKLARTAVLQAGYAPMNVAAGGEGGKKRFMPLLKIVRPYRKIRSQISQQLRGLKTPPKAAPPPPPDMLSKHGGRKTPVRSGDYEGVDMPRLWDLTEAGKRGKIRHLYPNRPSPHERERLTPEQVSKKAMERRDPIASHQARVKAGVTENLIVKREDRISGLPNTYLPKAVDIDERRGAQSIRDYLAGKLKSLRRETLQPMRAAARRNSEWAHDRANPIKPMPHQQIEAIRKSSEGLPDIEIAQGKPVHRPTLKPTVPIYGKEIHPAVINREHENFRARLAKAQSGHLSKAQGIKQNISNRAEELFARTPQDKFSKTDKELRHRVITDTFHPNRTYIEDSEVGLLAEHTGMSPNWIKSQHKAFVKHTFLGSSHAGEQKVAKGLNLNRFKHIETHIPGISESVAKHEYPVLKRLGKIGGISAGVVGSGILAKKLLDRRKPKPTEFSAISTISASTRRKLLEGVALTGGISAADAVVSGVHPDPDKTRTQSSWAGAKRGALYGGVLAGTEQALRKPLRKILFGQKEDNRRDLTRDIAIGGIEGGAGVLATDQLIRKFAPTGSPIRRKLLIGAGVGGLATGTIGYGVNRLLRRRQQSQTTQFQSIARSGKAVFHKGSKLDVEALVHKVGDRASTTVKIKSLKSLPRTKKSGFSERRVARSNIYRPIIIHGREVVDGRHRVVGRSRIGRDYVHAIKVTAKDLNGVKMRARGKPIQFDTQPTRYRRPVVAVDRYRKQIRDNEIARHESNVAKSAVAGAALSGVLGHKLLPGAIAGTAASTSLILANRKKKDQFGDASISTKRVERLPYEAAGGAATGIAVHKLYRKLHKFAQRGVPIQFEFIPTTDNSTPWHRREIAGWLKHPKSRVENAQKWISRAGRIRRDAKLQRTHQGNIIDERGRTRQPEWKKDWFKRSVIGGAATGALVGGALLHKRIKLATISGAALMKEGIQPSQFERFSLNASAGNVGRYFRGKLKSRFPKITTGVKKTGELGSEFRDIRDSFLKKANDAIEGQTGRITNARIKKNKQGDILGVHIDNPAEAKENLERVHAEEAKIEQRKNKLQRQRERIIKTQGTRGKLSKITTPPQEQFSSRSRPIQFQSDVYVRPHTRTPRRNKYKHEKKDFREGLLIGGGLGLGGLGAGAGLAYKSRFSDQAKRHVEKRRAEELAKFVVKRLNSNQQLITFKEQSDRTRHPLHRSTVLKNISISAGALGLGYGGFKAGQAAEHIKRSTPSFIASSAHKKIKGWISRARSLSSQLDSILNFESPHGIEAALKKIVERHKLGMSVEDYAKHRLTKRNNSSKMNLALIDYLRGGNAPPALTKRASRKIDKKI